MYGKRRYSYCYLGNDRSHSAPRRAGHRWVMQVDLRGSASPKTASKNASTSVIELAELATLRCTLPLGGVDDSNLNLGLPPVLRPTWARWSAPLRWGALGYWLVAVVLIVAIGRGPALGLLSRRLGWAAVIPGMVLTAEPSYQ